MHSQEPAAATAARRRKLGAVDEKDGKPKGTLRRVAVLFRPYRKRVGLIFIAVVITSALGVATPLLSRTVLDKALFPPSGNQNLHLLYVLVGLMFFFTFIAG